MFNRRSQNVVTIGWSHHDKIQVHDNQSAKSFIIEENIEGITKLTYTSKCQLDSLSVWWRKSDTNNLFIACIYNETDTIIVCQLTMMFKICWMVKNCSQQMRSLLKIIDLPSSGFLKSNHLLTLEKNTDIMWNLKGLGIGKTIQ